MSSYERLAASYDELTEDVDYQRRADFLERLFQPACRCTRCSTSPAGRGR